MIYDYDFSQMHELSDVQQEPCYEPAALLHNKL